MKTDKFDFNTISDFDNHILKSVPNYDILINQIKSMSEYFFEKDAIVYDLGCSTGKLLKSLPFSGLKIGYDNAKLMPQYDPDVTFETVDLNANFEIKNSCLVYSIFTLQFLKRSARLNYLRIIFNGLNEGGALIITEKIYQENGLLQEIMAFSHYDYKKDHFSQDEICSKEKDLRFIMKPNTKEQNIDLLNEVGFSKVTQFWQAYNFIGLIAVK